MFKKVILLLVLCLGAFANDLVLLKGKVVAHTEVFGDSEINPYTNTIQTALIIDDNVESIRGQIYFDVLTLVSNKKDRDENMYKLLNSQKYNKISFEITNIVKNETNYDISGLLNLNGVSKNITVKSNIIEEGNKVVLDGNFSFNLTDFKLEPPTMFFLTVRDQIDITYKISLKK